MHHSAFAKVRVDILQFYAMIKNVSLNEQALSALGEYSMNYEQRRELKSLLNGKAFVRAVLSFRFTGGQMRHRRRQEKFSDGTFGKDYF